ncbi:MAG: hypothetical protein RR048_02565 [Oscillospiraceae bacterium]
MNKKLLSFALAIAMLSSMATSAFANSGYDRDKVSKVEDTAIKEITISGIDKAFEGAEKGNGTAKVELNNAEQVTPDALKKVAEVAKQKGVQAIIQADKTLGYMVIGRLYINPVKAADLKEPIKLDLDTDNVATRSTFERYFENQLAIVKFAQPKTFGMPIRIAVKLDLSKIDTTKALRFYSYDSVANTYAEVSETNYVIDKNGYIHFTTERAGDILISDSPLVAKN